MEKKPITANAETKLEFSINFKLNYDEAKALEAMACYGINPFLDVFYPKLGKSYLEPHENGLKSLFHNIQKSLPKETDKIDKLKKAIGEALMEFKNT